MGEEVRLGKVDCTLSRKLHQRFEIDGFPTMYFFKYGQKVTYTGGNKEDSIVQWVRRHSMPSTTELPSIEAVQKKQEMVPVMVVGYFPTKSATIADAQKAYFETAEIRDNLNFYHTHSADVAKHLGLDNDGIAILKKFDEEHNVMNFEKFDSGEEISEAIKDFVRSMSYPLVSVFSKEKAREIFSPKIMVRLKLHSL